jgi:hypothetical protein
MQDFFNVQALRDWRVSVVDYEFINSPRNRMRASYFWINPALSVNPIQSELLDRSPRNIIAVVLVLEMLKLFALPLAAVHGNNCVGGWAERRNMCTSAPELCVLISSPAGSTNSADWRA